MLTARAAAILAALLLAACDALPQVRDGDSLTVGGKEVRLYGVDAPEWGQACGAGRYAAAWLTAAVRRGPVRCYREHQDQYGRAVSVCYAGEVNLNKAIVREGWAYAYRYYSPRYIADEQAARAAGLGVWSMACLKPWIYRRQTK